MLTSKRDNETSFIANKILNDLSQGLKSTSATFGLPQRPEGLGTQYPGGQSDLMALRNDAQGLLANPPPTSLDLKETTSDLPEWSPEEREALALGLYLFKADAEKICSIVGSKTVRTPKI
jgi:hypothetical protein